jgi:hypothetical protein
MSEWFTNLQKRRGFHDIVGSEEAASADAVLSKVSSYCFKEFVEVGGGSPKQGQTKWWTSGAAARGANF